MKVFEMLTNEDSIYIPMNVMHDKNLTPFSKIVFGEILTNMNQKGVCKLTNKHIANLYHYNTSTVTTAIKRLEENKYISVQTTYSNELKRPERIIIVASAEVKKFLKYMEELNNASNDR